MRTYIQHRVGDLTMRFFCFLVLAAAIAAVTVFAVQNDESVSIKYFDREISLPMAQLVGGVYALGMVSGWTVVGMLKRSIERVTDRG